LICGLVYFYSNPTSPNPAPLAGIFDLKGRAFIPIFPGKIYAKYGLPSGLGWG
jgi:hypothetical protein